MEPNALPTKSATRKRRWGIGIGLTSVATVAVLLWMLWPPALNDVENRLVGNWTGRANPGSIVITFHSDRTVAYQNPKMMLGSGQWWADSDSIYWDEGFKDVMTKRIRRILHGDPDSNKYTLLSIDDECFRIHVPINGSIHEFIRVPNSSVAPSQE